MNKSRKSISHQQIEHRRTTQTLIKMDTNIIKKTLDDAGTKFELRIESSNERIEITGDQWLVPFCAGICIAAKFKVAEVVKNQALTALSLVSWDCDLEVGQEIKIEDVTREILEALSAIGATVLDKATGQTTREYTVSL